VAKDAHRGFFHGELPGCLRTSVRRDDVIFCASQNWVCEAKFADRSRDSCYLFAALCVGGLLARGISRSIGQRSI
jgi:hypothetical protein